MKNNFINIYKYNKLSYFLYKEYLHDDYDILIFILDLIKNNKSFVDLLIYTKPDLFNELKSYAIFEPIYYWSQNNSHLFLKVKLNNKIDYPLNLKIDLYYIHIRPDKLIIRVIDTVNKVFFIWDLNYYQPILPKLSNYNYYNLNEIEINLKKSFNIIWRNAHYESKIIHKNQFEWVERSNEFIEDYIDEYNIIKKSENNIEKEERKKDLKIQNNIMEKKNKKYKKKYFKKKYNSFMKFWKNKNICNSNEINPYIIFILI